MGDKPQHTPIAWLRDLDGCGSLHACHQNDPDAIAVYGPDILARIERLTAAILAAHPAGQDPDADPLEVLKMLSNEWVEMTMAPPPAKVSFLDGETEREAVWEDGDESVGIRGGYTTEDDLVERLTEQRDALARAAEWIRETADHLSNRSDGTQSNELKAAWRCLDDALAALKGEDDDQE